MAAPDELVDEAMEIVERIAERLQDAQLTVAAAESLTGGKIACHLAAGDNSGEWFAGGVVAYASDVKYRVLGVTRGPVVTATAAEQMARGLARLMSADVGVAVTGVGGPDRQEGKPVGTVFIGLHTPNGSTAVEHHFDGEAEDILAATVVAALRMLESGIRDTR